MTLFGTVTPKNYSPPYSRCPAIHEEYKKNDLCESINNEIKRVIYQSFFYRSSGGRI